MFQIKPSRSPFVFFLFVCLLITAFLVARVDRVRAADPCSTVGVVCVSSNISSNTTWYSNTIYYVTSGYPCGHRNYADDPGGHDR